MLDYAQVAYKRMASPYYHILVMTLISFKFTKLFGLEMKAQ